MRKLGKTTPWIFLITISATLIILAKTNLQLPLMQFIHSDQITIGQIIACIIFSIAGLWLTFVLLNIISKYYTGKLKQVTDNPVASLPDHSTSHGGKQL